MNTFTTKGQADMIAPTVEHHGNNIADLLADIMHWCDHNDEDFDECLGMARKYYAQELRDEENES